MSRTLRLSVTERCNFRCRYCIPPEGFKPVSLRGILPLEEFGRAALWLVSNLGVRSIRLTGGEPLLREGLEGLVGMLSENDAVEEVTLTTNGSRLAELAGQLKKAGLSRVNVSLDTLNVERFRFLCNGEVGETVRGIDAAIGAGLTPLKLNTVLHKSWWKEDLPELLDFASNRGVELRLIELMPAGIGEEWANREFVSANEVMAWLKQKTDVKKKPHQLGNPSRLSEVKWGGGVVSVGWITPESNPFCDGCDRLRLDSQGLLRRCLMDSQALPLGELLKSRAESEVKEAIDQYLIAKIPPSRMSAGDAMIAVGG